MPGEIGLFDESFSALDRAMQIATQRQAVIAHNIANADTPNYIPLEFDEVLQKAIQRKEKKVNLELEMAALADNSTKYSAYTKLMTSKIGILRSIITQGRK